LNSCKGMVGWYPIDNSVHISPSIHKLSNFWFMKRPYITCRAGLMTWTLTMKYHTWKHGQTLLALTSSMLELIILLLIKLTETRAWKFVPYISLVPFFTMNNDMFTNVGGETTILISNNYPHVYTSHCS